MGKGRGGSAEAVYDRLCGLDVVMWFTGWVQVKTRAGSWAIWSAAGGLVVGIAVALREGERCTESEDS